MYKITMRIQDENSTDYECPFEASFGNKDISESVYNHILSNSTFWNDLICKQYGLTKEDKPWIQVFLTDDNEDFHNIDEEDYWLSYDVL